MIRVDPNDYLKKSKEEILRELEKLLNENERLKNELRKYKNPNTPPSAHPHLKPDVQTVRVNRRRGAPLNHPGATRPWKNPDEIREITAAECPKCKNRDINVIGQRHQQVEEFPRDIQPTIIGVCRDICKCNKCGFKFEARDGRTPLQGRFGVNLMVLTIFLKFIVRGVLRKTARFLEAGFAL